MIFLGIDLRREVKEPDMSAPRGIGVREVAPGVNASGFLSLQGGGDHQPGRREHILQGPAGGIVKDVAEDVATPEINLIAGLGKSLRFAINADGSPH